MPVGEPWQDHGFAIPGSGIGFVHASAACGAGSQPIRSMSGCLADAALIEETQSGVDSCLLPVRGKRGVTLAGNPILMKAAPTSALSWSNRLPNHVVLVLESEYLTTGRRAGLTAR